jgi:hypothetical protein
MSIEAMKQALEALEKLWDIIDDIDTYGDMAKSDDKLYRSLVERRQRQRFEQTGISTDGYELNGGAITALRQAIAEAEDTVAAEREACAKLVEADGLARGADGYMLIKAATRIRARGIDLAKVGEVGTWGDK